MEVLESNPAGLQSQSSWGFHVPLPDIQTGKRDRGAHNLYNFFDATILSLCVTHLEL